MGIFVCHPLPGLVNYIPNEGQTIEGHISYESVRLYVTINKKAPVRRLFEPEAFHLLFSLFNLALFVVHLRSTSKAGTDFLQGKKLLNLIHPYI